MIRLRSGVQAVKVISKQQYDCHRNRCRKTLSRLHRIEPVSFKEGNLHFGCQIVTAAREL